jgi:phosphoribosylformylglycinamidine synthase
MRFGVVVFPGSNCDVDCYHVLANVNSQPVEYVWHEETDLWRFDCIVLPGGFAHGDYLRAGAIARFSPVMGALAEFTQRGRLVLGICNGFQVLLEAGMLPGAMRRNANQLFVCKSVHLRLENDQTPFTHRGAVGSVYRIPVAHGEGNYYADRETLESLDLNNQVVFRYCDGWGETTEEANPNGSVDNIAGICNRQGNVLGMMPHPERCSEPDMGSTDGLLIWDSILSWTERAATAEVAG